MRLLKILSIFVAMFIADEKFLIAEQTNSEIASWKTWQISEYSLEFKYPPNAGAKENKIPFFRHDAAAGVSRSPDGIPGEITVDGLHQWPYSIKLSPEFTFWNGTIFRFPIRFIMLTDAAKPDPMWAKKYGWTEAPNISMYPFHFEQDKQSLLRAIEVLYLGKPRKWETVEPVTVDGKAGAKFFDWDTIGNEKYFEVIVATPVSTNKILFIHACCFPKHGSKSVTDLKTKQGIISNVVSSVEFLERK